MDLPDSWMVCIFLTTSEQLWCWWCSSDI
jgi:hypothetical protein